MNGALLQARLLEKKARIEAIKCRVAGFICHNEMHPEKYMSSEFFRAEEELNKLADQVKSLGETYALLKQFGAD